MKKIGILGLVLVFGLGLCMCDMKGVGVSGPQDVEMTTERNNPIFEESESLLEEYYKVFLSNCNEGEYEEQITATVQGHKITVLHSDAPSKLCCGSLYENGAEVKREGNVITIQEYSRLVGEYGCGCICYADYTIVGYNIPYGEYMIVVNGIYSWSSDTLYVTVSPGSILENSQI